MAITVSYTEAREHLAELWDRALADREPIRLTRRGSDLVVLVAADEYEGLVETVHLLRSPANAARLFDALAEARAGAGTPLSLNELRATWERELRAERDNAENC